MSRISHCFAVLKEQGRKGFIPFITAGYPRTTITVPTMHQLVRYGADLLEIGIPFSDPMADGSVIQRSSERALQQGVNLDMICKMIEEFRCTDTETPVILMGYLNNLEAYGYAQITKRLGSAGVDGVIVVDLPPEEASEIRQLFFAEQLDLIFLAAPTTSMERLKIISDASRGFVYYVSLKGVTGAALPDVAELTKQISQVGHDISLPLAVGFGIKEPAFAVAVAKVCDAVVVGSALVEKISELGNSSDAQILDIVGRFTDAFHQALDAEYRMRKVH